jgi:flagellar P-ring protein precursor FlgI
MFNRILRRNSWVVLFLVFIFLADTADAARIKDLANIRGVRSNQLIGFGVVIGLNNTGDSTINVFYATQSIVSMLRKMGITVPSNQILQLKFKNVATVMVTADLPAFGKQGDKIDVVVSSMGDSKSLQGGTLLMTPLKGHDGAIYAVAQGPLSIGGFAVQGASRTVQVNHLTAARVANGGIVEKELPNDFNDKHEIILSLARADFTTVHRVTKAINDELKEVVASTMDGRTVKVQVPPFYQNDATGFVTRIEGLHVEPDAVAKVIIDERTGTVVMGENVRISTVAVSHGGLMVQIKEVAPPQKPSSEQTKRERVPVPVETGQDRLVLMPRGAALGDIVNGLNAVGVSPKELIAVLQAIKAAGALQAELEIM